MRGTLHARLSLSVCFAAFTVLALGFPTVPPLKCVSEAASGERVACSLSASYYKEACSEQGRQEPDTATQSPHTTDQHHQEEDITVTDKYFNADSSLVDIKFSLWDTHRAVVVVTGRLAGRQLHHTHQRCVVVRLTTPQPGRVTLHDLTLPHGSYEVRIVKTVNTEGLDGVADGGGAGRGLMVRKHQFLLPTKRRRARILVRNRRHKLATSGPNHRKQGLSNTALILQNLRQLQYTTHHKQHQQTDRQTTEDRSQEGGPCVCCKCFTVSLDYNNMTAVLSFNYTLNVSCQPACSMVNVQLYREDQSLSTSQHSTEKPDDPLLGSERIGRDKNVTQGPIKYSNIDAGCYYVEMKPHPYPLPERTVPLCVVPLINVTDMEAWDPYFSLETNPQRQSLTVRWTVGEQYNFSSYDLTLHHHPSLRINCTGTAIYPNMSIIPQNRLEVNQSVYTFHNLSSGWYCARVTPLDDRCPLDGCPVVSSPAQLLLEPVGWKCDEEEDCGNKNGLGLILLVVGCVVGAIVTGITVA